MSSSLFTTDMETFGGHVPTASRFISSQIPAKENTEQFSPNGLTGTNQQDVCSKEDKSMNVIVHTEQAKSLAEKFQDEEEEKSRSAYLLCLREPKDLTKINLETVSSLYMMVDASLCDILFQRKQRGLHSDVYDFVEELEEKKKCLTLVNRLPDKKLFEKLYHHLPETCVKKYIEITVQKKKVKDSATGGARNKFKDRCRSEQSIKSQSGGDNGEMKDEGTEGTTSSEGIADVDTKMRHESDEDEDMSEECEDEPESEVTVNTVMIGSNHTLEIQCSNGQMVIASQEGFNNTMNFNLVPSGSKSKVILIVATTDENLDRLLLKEITDETELIKVRLGASSVKISSGSVVMEIEVKPGVTINKEYIEELLKVIFSGKAGKVIPEGTKFGVDIQTKMVVPFEQLGKFVHLNPEYIHENCVPKEKYEEKVEEVQQLQKKLAEAKREGLQERKLQGEETFFHPNEAEKAKDNVTTTPPFSSLSVSEIEGKQSLSDVFKLETAMTTITGTSYGGTQEKFAAEMTSGKRKLPTFEEIASKRYKGKSVIHDQGSDAKDGSTGTPNIPESAVVQVSNVKPKSAVVQVGLNQPSFSETETNQSELQHEPSTASTDKRLTEGRNLDQIMSSSVEKMDENVQVQIETVDIPPSSKGFGNSQVREADQQFSESQAHTGAKRGLGSEDRGRLGRSRLHASLQTEGSEVEVVFHALVTEDMKLNRQEDEIYIRCSLEVLGGFNTNRWKMTFVKDVGDGVCEYSGSIMMSREVRNRGFKYKYVVQRPDRVTWEEPHYRRKEYKSYSHMNRQFQLPAERNRFQGIWHQFDGFIYAPQQERGILGTMRSWMSRGSLEDHVRNDVQLAVQVFMPTQQEILDCLSRENPLESNTAEDLVDRVFMIFSCLSKQMLDRSLFSVDPQLKERIFLSFFEPLQVHLKTLLEEENSSSRDTMLIVLVSFLLLVAWENDMSHIFLREPSLLKASLPRPNFEERTCPGLEAVKHHFRTKASNDLVVYLRQSINSYSQLATCSVSPCESRWMYLVPLLHFLRKDSEPFVKEYERRILLGHEEIGAAKDTLKRIPVWTVPFERLVVDMEFLFEVDHLLPSTLMACALCLDLKETMMCLSQIPAEISCAYFHLYLRSRSNFSAAEKVEIANALSCIAERYRRQWTVTSTSTEIDRKFQDLLAEAKQKTKLSLDVFSTCLEDQYQDEGLVAAAASLVLSSLWDGTFSKPIHELPKKHQEEFRKCMEHLHEQLNRAFQTVLVWMKERFTLKQGVQTNELWLWDFLISAQVPPCFVEFREVLIDAFRGKLSQMDPTYGLELYFNEDSVSTLVQDCLTKAAFNSFEKLAMSIERLPMTEGTSNKFGKLISELLVQNWPKGDNMDTSEVLNFILSWTHLKHFFDNYYGKSASSDLTQECSNYLSQAASLLDSLKTEVCSGEIHIRHLRLILGSSDYFLELWSTVRTIFSSVDKGKAFDSDILKFSLQARQKELGACERLVQSMNLLLNMAVYIDNVRSDNQYDRLREVDRLLLEGQIQDICNPLILKEVPANLNTYIPKISLFDVSDELLQIVPQLEQWQQSMIFQTLWEKESKTVEAEMDLNTAVLNVWKKVKALWIDLSARVVSGSATFRQVQKHIRMFQNDYEKIKKEFMLMGVDEENPDWVDDRILQLKCYETLKECQISADILMKIRVLYKLSGDFSPIEAIQILGNSNDEAMKTMNSSVLETCATLEGMNESKKQKCIRAFQESHKLVFWLRDSMKDGLKELRVFVELASNSAGEEPMEIHKVNCFHSATTGYAPLIFNTPPDCDLVAFLQNCKLVWQELDADPKLPEKLIDTERHLEWLKEVKQLHGSVEVRSLTQAGNINTKGHYRIGNLDNLDTISDLSLNKVISVHVSEDITDDRSAKKYNYEQLVDLQSRLMLVAGQAEKGKENVDYFLLVLDGIVRLAKTYIRLLSDGCVLFNCWKGRFLCGEDRRACALLEFRHGANLEILKGHQDKKEGVEQFILSLANQFEKFHEAWLKYVSEKRDEYLELNHFTIQQLVFLQKELIKLGSEHEPSLLIYPLLSLIKPNCSQADLTSAMQEARDRVFAKEENQVEMEVHEQVEIDDPRQTFIDAMLESSFSEKLARLALDAIGPEDIDNGIVWCMEHQNEFQEDEESSEPSATQRFAGWQVGEASVASNTVSWVRSIASGTKLTVRVADLMEDLETVWTKYLDSISSSVADYLSLEHLGIILKQLANANDEPFARHILPVLKCGTPNLIVCQQVDMINAVLYLYKHSKEEPLPRPDEVLLCTPQTTFDQVDIFLRRAFFGNPGKLYTLANADLLLYEIEEMTEKKMKEYASKVEGTADYQLVVLCSTENEFKARIVAALERNRCPPPPLQNLRDFRHYLLTKFSQTFNTQTAQSAALLDFNNSNVRVIKSKRAGVGKSLYKKRLEESLSQRDQGLQQQNPRVQPAVTIHIYNKTLSTTAVVDKLLPHTLRQDVILPRIFHLDISYEVQEGVDYLLFNLLILGCISNSNGQVWLKSPLDLYLVETIPIHDSRHDRRASRRLIHPLLEILPDVHCWSPQDSLQILTNDVKPEEYSDKDRLFDNKEFRSLVYQRPFQYLNALHSKSKLGNINLKKPVGDHQQCLRVLLQHCGVRDPAWSELHNFVWFLNTQLEDFEKSAFCSDAVNEDLPGFRALVLQFLIQMSRDFATRSLVMSEQTPLDELRTEETEEEDLAQFQMKRTWESSPHPYIFFNPDGHTMTFLGFNIQRETGNMVDHQTGRVLERGLVSKPLQDGLRRNHVNINENFDQMNRLQRLEKLCNVMSGVDSVHDPDDTYELTTDNVKKILAIYMRFRCGIPVIIMGETGCGKTRLVKFMCALQCPDGSDIENMVIMKVHGGTTADDIIRKVKQAEKLAAENKAKNKHMYTVLFFDEANTTEAIGLIKEIMCDGAIDGQPLRLDKNLKIVAACNPYRKHSDQLIRRLEKAGLGYHVDADKTTDKLGRVPMRRLVYRVQPLPQSMLPLVWDFGQLNIQVEELYVKQMVNRYVRDRQVPALRGEGIAVVSQILIAAQDFMRQQADECSFVSLRDVDRTLSVMAWFIRQSKENRTLFDRIDKELSQAGGEEEEMEEGEISQVRLPDYITESLILALSVCYRASLRSRDEFDYHIIQYFKNPCVIPGGLEQMVAVINSCQSMFVDEVHLKDNIAKNLALKENLFMMVVCIELRIPLFLVGKPGSSKSLAKTIVADAMQGNTARSELFKQLKKIVQVVSFQCSPISRPEGIVGSFQSCARYQKDTDLSRFVSILVLDEVGLAEDSPLMPLKTLHPLLEDGCQGNEKAEPFKKVAFIGISNWALDPAKMNRGILVQREVPDDRELVESAQGICSSSEIVLRRIKPLLPQLAEAYRTIFHRSQATKREFFGLRDYYSLVKMLYEFVEKTNRNVCWHQLKHAVLRNFGGLDNLDPVLVFRDKITTVNKHEEPHADDPDCTTIGLIKAGLFGDGTSSESRYLLLLTENYGALSILQQQILARHRVITIFGSSFPKDQEYTQICRNINRIKVCMETGNTVILLNLENLYESLYDALNQYYAICFEERFVDLGLGTHRVKCKVHKNFRLIVVAEKQKVYEEFPIPLINRLEKHLLTLNNMMTKQQIAIAERLDQWAVDFVTPKIPSPGRRTMTANPGDAFMGYHPDTAAAILLQVSGRTDRIDNIEDEMFCECQDALLWSATPASVVRLSETKLHLEANAMHRTYYQQQKHDDIYQYLQWTLLQKEEAQLQAQITTHSKLLTDQEKEELARHLNLMLNHIILLTLQSFDTEQQFAQQIKNFIKRCDEGQKLVLIQCGSGDRNQSLIKSAQYCVMDEILHHDNFAVVFIVQLPNIAGGCFSGFQAGKWHSLHLDELRPPAQNMPTMEDLHHYPPSSILEGIRSNAPATRVQPNERTIEPMDLMGPESLPIETSEQTATEMMDIEEHITDPIPAVVGISAIELQEAEMMSVSDSVAPYIQNLLLPCIQSVAALIKDETFNSRRSTKRIEILLYLLDNKNNEDAQVFIFGLSRLLISLLREKEEQQTGALPANWLSKEAAKPENVRKAGTFRRAAMQCLENKITPIMAGVVAFLDTHRNLEFMFSKDQAPWTRRLWLEVMKNTQMCHGQCRSIIAPGDQYHQGEVSTLDSGSSFPIRTPFFWLMYHDVSKAILEGYNTYSDTEVPCQFLDYVVDVIKETEFGHILTAFVEQSFKGDFIRAYLQDFIETVYYGQTTEKDLKILCDAVESAARQSERDLDSLNAVQAVVNIHLIHADVKERLNLFLEVQQIWPEITQAVTDMKEKVAGNPLLTRNEMTLDVLSVMILLEQLEPSKEQLNSDRGRTEWMDRVKTFLPIIEKIIKSSEADLPHGPVCCRHLEQAKCAWSRVLTMKFFLESFTGNPKIQLEQRCMPFWKMLGNETDLGRVESLEKVERFLKSINKSVVKKIAGKIGKCIHCDTEFEAPPVELPCKDLICLRCFNDLQVSNDLVCPRCNNTIPRKFKPGNGPTQKEESFKEYQEYLKCCNNFLMLVVSKLCFGGNTVPDGAVIERIFSYITRRVDKGHQTGRVYTKEMSVFDDMIDPTPVVRSFLLQLLIHKSKETVEGHLRDFFHQATHLCQQEQGETSTKTIEEIVQFSLLVIHCFEDLYHESGSSFTTTEITMQNAGHQLQAGKIAILHKALDVEKMLTIAQCRYGLTAAAYFLNAVLVTKQQKSSPAFREFLQKIADLLGLTNTEWPKKFLVKQICREFGTDSYHTICNNRAAAWLKLESDEQVAECPDRYVVCLEYQKVREALAKTLLGENIKHLKQLVQDSEMPFLLALHREVTMRNIKHPTEIRLNVQSLNEVEEFIRKTKRKVTLKELSLKVLTNQLGRPGSRLNIQPGMSARNQSLACLLFHVQLAIVHFNKMKGFLKPLIDLITAPQTMMGALLPTMPQDDMDVVRQGLAERVVFYRCPNGHPYAIGECGRPYVEATCHCGLKIGGQSHKTAQGNIQDTGVDQTRPGYILGRATDRTNHSVGERQLEGATCAVLRFFTHAALFLGTETDAQAVSGLVTPAVREDMGEFFWQHLQKDLEIIHLASGKSVDDVLLLLHSICHQITQSGNYSRCEEQRLTSKPQRETWENMFAKSLIRPILRDLDTCLNKINERILKDKRIGQDKLMSVLYEVDKSRPAEVERLHEFPAVWRYRSRITLNHFLREFNIHIEGDKDKKSKMAVLSLFSKEHPFLQALQNIPHIIRLQQVLMSKYRRRFDRSQATEMTIADAAASDASVDTTLKELMPEFAKVWSLVKEHLHSYGCWTVHNSLIHLPDAYKNMTVDENSPLAVLLPSTQGPGICSFMTIEFLLRKHNEFMDNYCKITKTSFSRLPEVSVRKLHDSHLVSYHPDRDLLPLVLANCNYSFELGKGTKIDYDFSGFEYQLRESILQAKSRVEQKGHVIPIETVVFRADTSSAEVFRTLRDIIPQESLAPAVRHQILVELKGNLPDIYNSINNLDIAISFLKSLGGDPEKSLQTFMLEALKMKHTILSQKARQFCRFKHAQSLWLLLSFEKSVVLAQHGQDAFDNLDDEFKEKLLDTSRGELKEFTQSQSVEKLELLLQQMFDCLLLRVAHTADPRDQDAIDIKPIKLRDLLQGEIDAPLYSKEPDETLSVEDIATFPAEILGKHIPDTWVFILRELTQKRREKHGYATNADLHFDARRNVNG